MSINTILNIIFAVVVLFGFGIVYYYGWKKVDK